MSSHQPQQQPANKRHTDHQPAKSKLKATEQILDDDIDPELAQIDENNNTEDLNDAEDTETEVPDIKISSDKDMNGKGFSKTEKIGRKSNRYNTRKYVRWAGYVWRRGMVPLWWQILVCNNISFLLRFLKLANSPIAVPQPTVVVMWTQLVHQPTLMQAVLARAVELGVWLLVVKVVMVAVAAISLVPTVVPWRHLQVTNIKSFIAVQF